MGDTTDGSQEAAQRAQAEVTPQEDTHISFLDWALRRRGRAATNEPRPATDLDRASAAGARQMLVNLRKMGGLRVENVAIPRADIVAVADDISLSDLMDVFRESGYGADGLITMEDLVEQIVGEIADEHDATEDLEWTSEADGVYRASARADLREFEAVAGVDLLPDDLDEDVDTLGGLVFMLAGRVPVRGEVVRHPAGHEFEVLDADARRLTRMRVRLSKSGKARRAAE